MHQLTGDFFTVGEILGHTLKGIGMSLGISTNLDAATATYVDVRMERKQLVLDKYHNTVHPERKKEIEEWDRGPKDRGER
jgi:integrase